MSLKIELVDNLNEKGTTTVLVRNTEFNQLLTVGTYSYDDANILAGKLSATFVSTHGKRSMPAPILDSRSKKK